MKKCKCGNEMEDWMTLCKDCYAKQQNSQPESRDRQESIERQVAAKCAAQVYESMGFKLATDGVSQEQVVSTFNLFLRLIRGK
jgi:hypothetical protein